MLLISNCLSKTGYIKFYLNCAYLNYGKNWYFPTKSPKENSSFGIWSLSWRNGCENLDHRCPDLTESWTEERQEKASEVALPRYGNRYPGLFHLHSQFLWLMSRILFTNFARRFYGQLNIRNLSEMKMTLKEIWRDNYSNEGGSHWKGVESYRLVLNVETMSVLCVRTTSP